MIFCLFPSSFKAGLASSKVCIIFFKSLVVHWHTLMALCGDHKADIQAIVTEAKHLQKVMLSNGYQRKNTSFRKGYEA